MQSWTVADSLPLATPADATRRLAELFDAHQPQLYRLARRLAASRDDALDLVQDTFLAAAAHLPAVPSGLREEEAWLVRVLVNRQRDRWRRGQVRERHARAQPPAVATSGSEEALVAGTVVWQALDRLAPRRRAIVVLHELDGRSAADIAALLGISQVTVRWHLSRGRKELASWLRPLTTPTRRIP